MSIIQDALRKSERDLKISAPFAPVAGPPSPPPTGGLPPAGGAPPPPPPLPGNTRGAGRRQTGKVFIVFLIAGVLALAALGTIAAGIWYAMKPPAPPPPDSRQAAILRTQAATNPPVIAHPGASAAATAVAAATQPAPAGATAAAPNLQSLVARSVALAKSNAEELASLVVTSAPPPPRPIPPSAPPAVPAADKPPAVDVIRPVASFRQLLAPREPEVAKEPHWPKLAVKGIMAGTRGAQVYVNGQWLSAGDGIEGVRVVDVTAEGASFELGGVTNFIRQGQSRP